MKDDGFRIVLMRGGIRKKNSCSTPDLMDMTEVLRKQVASCEKVDIAFRPELDNALSRAAFRV